MKAIIDENAARQRELEFHQQGTEYLREEIVKLRNDKEQQRQYIARLEQENQMMKSDAENKGFRYNEFEVVIDDLKNREA